MAAARPHLAKDNTMKVTAKEGVDFLKAEGAKDLLKAQGLIPDVKRVGTMENTAKEAQGVLAGMGGKVDDDAQTRGQQKQLDAIAAEPPAKKARLSKNTTMAATAQEAKGILAGEKLGDTRQVTKTKKKTTGGTPQKQTSIQRCIAESQYFVADVDTSEGRQTRAQKRGDVYTAPEKKSRPAKAGGAKRGRKPKKAAAAAEPSADAE